MFGTKPSRLLALLLAGASGGLLFVQWRRRYARLVAEHADDQFWWALINGFGSADALMDFMMEAEENG